MAGSLLNRAKADSKKYIMSGGFEENITLITPDGNTVIETTGFATKHWINFSTDGLDSDTKNAHICVSESELIDKNYPVRNANGEVFLRSHRVNVVDSSGIIKNYVINQWYPNETTGLIVCILGDFEL